MSKKIDIATHPFFRLLKEGYFNKWEFWYKFKQFRRAVAEWGIVLTNLLVRETDSAKREVLANNLRDELGHGTPSKFHIETFEEFLARCPRFGGSTAQAKKIDKQGFPNLEKFLETLQQLSSPGSNGVSLDYVYTFLGTIEQLYVQVSQQICVCVQIESDEYIPHYTEHSVLDVEHAADLLKLVPPNGDRLLAEMAKNNATKLFYKVFDDFLPSSEVKKSGT
jgi:hypothetical protein